MASQSQNLHQQESERILLLAKTKSEFVSALNSIRSLLGASSSSSSSSLLIPDKDSKKNHISAPTREKPSKVMLDIFFSNEKMAIINKKLRLALSTTSSSSSTSATQSPNSSGSILLNGSGQMDMFAPNKSMIVTAVCKFLETFASTSQGCYLLATRRTENNNSSLVNFMITTLFPLATSENDALTIGSMIKILYESPTASLGSNVNNNISSNGKKKSSAGMMMKNILGSFSTPTILVSSTSSPLIKALLVMSARIFFLNNCGGGLSENDGNDINNNNNNNCNGEDDLTCQQQKQEVADSEDVIIQRFVAQRLLLSPPTTTYSSESSSSSWNSNNNNNSNSQSFSIDAILLECMGHLQNAPAFRYVLQTLVRRHARRNLAETALSRSTKNDEMVEKGLTAAVAAAISQHGVGAVSMKQALVAFKEIMLCDINNNNNYDIRCGTGTTDLFCFDDDDDREFWNINERKVEESRKIFLDKIVEEHKLLDAVLDRVVDVVSEFERAKYDDDEDDEDCDPHPRLNEMELERNLDAIRSEINQIKSIVECRKKEIQIEAADILADRMGVEIPTAAGFFHFLKKLPGHAEKNKIPQTSSLLVAGLKRIKQFFEGEGEADEQKINKNNISNEKDSNDLLLLSPGSGSPPIVNQNNSSNNTNNMDQHIDAICGFLHWCLAAHIDHAAREKQQKEAAIALKKLQLQQQRGSASMSTGSASGGGAGGGGTGTAASSPGISPRRSSVTVSPHLSHARAPSPHSSSGANIAVNNNNNATTTTDSMINFLAFDWETRVYLADLICSRLLPKMPTTLALSNGTSFENSAGEIEFQSNQLFKVMEIIFCLLQYYHVKEENGNNQENQFYKPFAGFSYYYYHPVEVGGILRRGSSSYQSQAASVGSAVTDEHNNSNSNSSFPSSPLTPFFTEKTHLQQQHHHHHETGTIPPHASRRRVTAAFSSEDGRIYHDENKNNNNIQNKDEDEGGHQHEDDDVGGEEIELDMDFSMKHLLFEKEYYSYSFGYSPASSKSRLSVPITATSNNLISALSKLTNNTNSSVLSQQSQTISFYVKIIRLCTNSVAASPGMTVSGSPATTAFSSKSTSPQRARISGLILNHNNNNVSGNSGGSVGVPLVLSPNIHSAATPSSNNRFSELPPLGNVSSRQQHHHHHHNLANDDLATNEDTAASSKASSGSLASSSNVQQFALVLPSALSSATTNRDQNQNNNNNSNNTLQLPRSLQITLPYASGKFRRGSDSLNSNQSGVSGASIASTATGKYGPSSSSTSSSSTTTSANSSANPDKNNPLQRTDDNMNTASLVLNCGIDNNKNAATTARTLDSNNNSSLGGSSIPNYHHFLHHHQQNISDSEKICSLLDFATSHSVLCLIKSANELSEPIDMIKELVAALLVELQRLEALIVDHQQTKTGEENVLKEQQLQHHHHHHLDPVDVVNHENNGHILSAIEALKITLDEIFLVLLSGTFTSANNNNKLDSDNNNKKQQPSDIITSSSSSSSSPTSATVIPVPRYSMYSARDLTQALKAKKFRAIQMSIIEKYPLVAAKTSIVAQNFSVFPPSMFVAVLTTPFVANITYLIENNGRTVVMPASEFASFSSASEEASPVQSSSSQGQQPAVPNASFGVTIQKQLREEIALLHHVLVNANESLVKIFKLSGDFKECIKNLKNEHCDKLLCNMVINDPTSKFKMHVDQIFDQICSV